ncbi:hypothetical protein LPJ73_002969 [Coemansia sp. RSA 2703]|nr:hypothetical protein LPJ73_002969 [Coemansia sp. RSA 2703]
MICSAINSVWIHYEFRIAIEENGDVTGAHLDVAPVQRDSNIAADGHTPGNGCVDNSRSEPEEQGTEVAKDLPDPTRGSRSDALPRGGGAYLYGTNSSNAYRGYK